MPKGYQLCLSGNCRSPVAHLVLHKGRDPSIYDTGGHCVLTWFQLGCFGLPSPPPLTVCSHVHQKGL